MYSRCPHDDKLCPTHLVYRSDIYPQEMTFRYGLGGRLGLPKNIGRPEML